MSRSPSSPASASRERAQAAQYLTEVDDRGRLHLPLEATRAVTWLKQRDQAVPALVILKSPGRLRLLSWEPEGSRIQARREALMDRIDANAGDTEALEILVLLEDRYKTLSIPKESRPTLPKEVLLHLNILHSIPCLVYLERYGEVLEVLSPTYRNERLSTYASKLGDLP